MRTDFLYRGINEKMYQASNGELRPKGIVVLTDLYPSNYLTPSDNLILGKSKQNAMDKHQNQKRKDENNFASNSAYLSTTPIYEVARNYATNSEKGVGYIFTIDRTKLGDYNIEEYLVNDTASIVYEPKDKEVLLLTNPHGKYLNSDLILKIEKVSPII